MQVSDAIVVGGGFAGVMAARELSRANMDVLLLEGRDRLGGRTVYRAFADTEFQVDLGGTYFDERQTHVMRETERYGLELIWPQDPERFVWCLAGRRWEGGFPIHWEEAAAAEGAIAQLRRAAARLELERPHFLQDIAGLDVSVKELVDGLGAGPITRDLLLAWASLYTGTDEHQASALFHLHSIAALGGSPVSLAPALTLGNGTSSLIRAMAADITGEIRLSAPVASISQHDGGVVVVGQDGEEFRASRAVVALPVNTLADVSFDPPLHEGKRVLAQDRHAARGFKFFALVENVPERVQAVGWNVEGGVVWLSTTALIGDRNLLEGFSYPCPGFSPFDLHDVQRAVDVYLPGARVVAVDGHDWNTDPFSQGTWMVPKPGQLTSLPTAHNLDEGRLHFAGADFSLRWLSWIEGALETGYEASHRLLAA